MSEYTKSVHTLANALYQYREMSDEFAYLRDERQEEYLEEALFIHYSSWLAAEIRKARAEGWDRAIMHVEIWIKFNLGKDTLHEFEDDDHPNPYEDDEEAE